MPDICFPLIRLLVDGEIIEVGETASIFGAPAKERTRHYLRMGS